MLTGGCGARRGKAGRPDHPRQRHVEMNGCAGSMQADTEQVWNLRRIEEVKGEI